jgi:hypothetical protein
MRIAGLCIACLGFLSACVWRPDAEHMLVARSESPGGPYLLVSVPPPRWEPVPESETSSSKLIHQRISLQATEAYVRSQIKWIHTSANIRFHLGDEQFVKLHGEYFVVVAVAFVQSGRHNCSQWLSVLVSVTGVPVGVYADGLATCSL